MRFIRLGAFLAWGAFASFAVAGFAAFNPTAAPAEQPVTSVTMAVVANQDTGLLAGRVAAMNFASTLPQTTTPRNPNVDAHPLTSAVNLDSVDIEPATDSSTDSSTTTAISETTIATSDQTSPTTSPDSTPTTTQATTPVADTTTTTVPSTTTTEAEAGIVVPAGTEPWVSLVEAYFAPADIQRALDVMWCESRGNADATNSASGAAGLYQHLPIFWEERSTEAGWAGASIYDPTANTAVAAWLVYSGGGWKHWNPSAYCWG